METRLFDTTAVERCAPLSEVVTAVEAAFGAYARETVVMPPKSYVELPAYNGDFRSMPAYLDVGEWDAAGVKWVNVHPDNPIDHDLPTVMGILIYSDPATAVPLAIMDGTMLTQLRTGAAAAVATNYLAITDATSLGIIGAGVQSYTQLEAISTVRPIEQVVICDRNEAKMQAFADAFADRFEIQQGSIEEAAACDVLSTVTPVREPIVSRNAVGPQTHINAMGADAPGKHELADEILLDAKLVIDDYEQCVHSGEINVPWSAEILSDADLHAELGSIVLGDRLGRTEDDGITVFDSTGLAIQDLAAAHVVYENAEPDETSTTFSFIDTPQPD